MFPDGMVCMKRFNIIQPQYDAFACLFSVVHVYTYAKLIAILLRPFRSRAKVFSGHQPHGESPTVVRHVRSGLLVVTADTSCLGCEIRRLT